MSCLFCEWKHWRGEELTDDSFLPDQIILANVCFRLPSVPNGWGSLHHQLWIIVNHRKNVICLVIRMTY